MSLPDFWSINGSTFSSNLGTHFGVSANVGQILQWFSNEFEWRFKLGKLTAIKCYQKSSWVWQPKKKARENTKLPFLQQGVLPWCGSFVEVLGSRIFGRSELFTIIFNLEVRSPRVRWGRYTVRNKVLTKFPSHFTNLLQVVVSNPIQKTNQNWKKSPRYLQVSRGGNENCLKTH